MPKAKYIEKRHAIMASASITTKFLSSISSMKSKTVCPQNEYLWGDRANNIAILLYFDEIDGSSEFLKKYSEGKSVHT